MITPVSFEIAKLLKDKSFDKKVFRYFDIYYETPTDIYSLGSFENWNIQPNLISAPTIADVVMWLYEKHGIWIEVRKSYTDGFVAIIKSPRIELDRCSSPTEAYEAAIEYALKNLI